MDPLIALDCAQRIPNRFAIVLAAAARARALNRGAEPQIPSETTSAADLALRELAAGAIGAEECGRILLPFHDADGGSQEFRGAEADASDATKVSLMGKRHCPRKPRERRSINVEERIVED